MQFYKELYVSDILKKRKNKLIRELKQKKVRPGIYVITLPSCDHNQLEFYSSVLLKQKLFDRDDIFIVGIADGYLDALYLVQEIYDDILSKTNNTDIRRYIEKLRLEGGV